MAEVKRAVLRSLRWLMKPAIHALGRLKRDRGSDPDTVRSPRRILILHPGHIGDIVIATALIDPLRSKFPSAEIGFVVGSWSAAVLKDVEGVSAIHTLDHWRLNRGSLGLLAKWKHYQRMRRQLVRELRIREYDVAISILNVDPDLLDVSWAAGIPVRIGFRHSQLASLATHTVEDDTSAFLHQAQRQARTLLPLGIEPLDHTELHSRLAPDSDAARVEVQRVLGESGPEQSPYKVIHVGCGSELKEMPEAFWRVIAEHLSQTGRVVFTGRGPREQAMIGAVMEGLENCVDACDRLSWSGFVAMMRGAEAVYAVDSMAGHVAAAADRVTVTACPGTHGVARWRPMGPLATVFSRHVPCAPCGLLYGCAIKFCKEIDPHELIQVTDTV